jgi:hypothetical protein
MKTLLEFIGGACAAVICGLVLSGCAGTRIKQVTGEEFMNRATPSPIVNSAFWQSYIGCSGSKAYLEYGCPAFIGAGVRTTVYWTPISQLPNNIVEQIKSRKPQWPATQESGQHIGAR